MRGGRSSNGPLDAVRLAVYSRARSHAPCRAYRTARRLLHAGLGASTQLTAAPCSIHSLTLPPLLPLTPPSP